MLFTHYSRPGARSRRGGPRPRAGGPISLRSDAHGLVFAARGWRGFGLSLGPSSSNGHAARGEASLRHLATLAAGAAERRPASRPGGAFPQAERPDRILTWEGDWAKVLVRQGAIPMRRASGLSSVGRVRASQAWGRGFESRSPLQNDFFNQSISIPNNP